MKYTPTLDILKMVQIKRTHSMNRKIFRLPETVINQIAAGEVVENPASIVKELIENSLDAGAKRIDIEIAGGGQQLIRVEDDGFGMSPEDALLSLERYATSKIGSVDDLQTLQTMGFRGEALAAISSVCHFELKTSNGVATRVLAEGGKIIAVEPCARNQGTTIEVRSLFYNVPARKKFQKSQGACSAAVSKMVEGIALAHPEIAFSFNGRQFAPSGVEERIQEILGEHEHEVKGKGVFGFVASPSKAMAMRTGQYLYINKRPIFSPLIAKAVKEAFGTRIDEHLYPRFVLFLDLPPDLFDVNVHPQKREVRFSDESAVFRLVQKAVEGAFAPQKTFSEPLFFNEPERVAFAESFPAMAFKVEETKLDWILDERPLAILGKFLLLQHEKILFVDLKAAHSRILFENFQIEKGNAQALMVPIEIPLLAGDEEKAGQLEQLGIECRILKKSLVIDALPPFLDGGDFPKFYAEWKGGKKMEEITTRFCRSLQKKFTFEQALALWKQVQKCKDRLYDPLGNPIFIELGEDDLARLMMKKLHG